MPKKFRVFVDTSALLAGLNSPTGAAGVVLAACFSGDVVPVISPDFLRASVQKRCSFPLLIPQEFLEKFLRS